MRVRNQVFAAAAIIAATAISSERTAHAQGSVQKPAAAPVTLAKGDHVFAPPIEGAEAATAAKPPTVLDEAWARALRAVVEGVKHLVDGERIEAEEAIQPARVPPLQPVVPAWRTTFTPTWASVVKPAVSALRETIATAPVQVTPVVATPPTESPADTRGEHAVLLGARMGLPWLVP